MKSERKKRTITLSILLVAVLAISVGFAAYSATLKINSSMIVNPDDSRFKVLFSSSDNSLETNAVKASPETMGSDATIDNTTVPTISNLTAKFTKPGDSVTYTFYVRNEGGYVAHLNSISFVGKKCIAEEGTSDALAIRACTSITATISVGDVTTTSTKTDITGETLTPAESKQVTVTLSYDSNGARADGPFMVEFGYISMYYGTISGMNDEIELACNLTYDKNSNGQADLQDEVTCGTESFYVIRNDSTAHPTAIGDNITLITKYNLDVGNIYDGSTNTPISIPTGIQNSNAIGWKSDGYPYYGVVYRHDINTYADNYKTYMENIVGVDVKEAAIPTLYQYNDFKLYTNFNFTSFWLEDYYIFNDYYGGSTNVPYHVSSNGNCAYTANTDKEYGVRPVIIISKSDIGIPKN